MTRYTPQWLQAGLYAASVDRRLIGAIWPGAATTGCAVSLASGMTVNIAAGTVAVPTQNGTGSTLCTSDAVEQVTLPAAPGSGVNRYDLIVCQPRGNDLDGGANNDFVFSSVQGTAVASPTVPATPAGMVTLATVYLPGGSASISAGNIADQRPVQLAANSTPPPIFGNTTARDINWPVPPNGAMCITRDTYTAWVRVGNVWEPLGAHELDYQETASASGAIGTTFVNVLTSSFTLQRSSRVDVHATGWGAQTGSGTILTVQFSFDAGTPASRQQAFNAAVSTNINFAHMQRVTLAPGAHTVRLQVASSLGSFTVQAAQLSLEVV